MKPFTTAASVIFVLVAIAQLLRVLLGWAVQVGQFLVPSWFGVIACLVAAILPVMQGRERGTCVCGSRAPHAGTDPCMAARVSARGYQGYSGCESAL